MPLPPRWITVDDHIRDALRFAQTVSPAGSRNLIAPHESYLSLLQQIVRPARDILHAHNLKGFHELRGRTHASAMSKSHNTVRLSTEANVAR